MYVSLYQLLYLLSLQLVCTVSSNKRAQLTTKLVPFGPPKRWAPSQSASYVYSRTSLLFTCLLFSLNHHTSLLVFVSCPSGSLACSVCLSTCKQPVASRLIKKAASYLLLLSAPMHCFLALHTHTHTQPCPNASLRSI